MIIFRRKKLIKDKIDIIKKGYKYLIIIILNIIFFYCINFKKKKKKQNYYLNIQKFKGILYINQCLKHRLINHI